MSDATRTFTATDMTSAEGGVDALESVGGALRKARELRGLSLPQVSRDLCLKEDVLRALESRQYSALPKVPYCFGFVRTYARYLNLEPEEMVRRFKGEIGDAPPPAKLQPPQPIGSGKFSGRVLVTLSVLIAAAAYGGWYFYMAPEGITVPATTADAHDPMPPVMPIDSATAKKLNIEIDTAADPAKPGATTSATPPTPAKMTVVIKATATCWVFIHDQKGKVVFHKTMQKGEQFQVPDHNGELVVDIGNPVAVQVIVNGRPLKPAPGSGKAWRLSLDPKELARQP